MIPIETRRKI